GSGIGVAVGGSSFSSKQLDLIKNLPIEEVVIALDKEWEEVGSPVEKYYAEKIKRVFRDKLDIYCNVSVIHDMKRLQEEKDRPTDKGFDTWQRLWDNRLYISETGGIIMNSYFTDGGKRTSTNIMAWAWVSEDGEEYDSCAEEGGTNQV